MNSIYRVLMVITAYIIWPCALTLFFYSIGAMLLQGQWQLFLYGVVILAVDTGAVLGVAALLE